MELNRFEKKLKKELGCRRIAPATESWDKLESKLDAEENKRTSKPWKYVAAVVAILVIAGSTIWNLNYSETPQVVEEPINEIIEKPILEQQKPVLETQIASEEIVINKGASAANEASHLNKSLDVKEAPQISPISEEKNIGRVVVLETISLEPPMLKQEVVQNKVEEVIAVTKNNEKITNDELDALLAEAAAQISEARDFVVMDKNGTISANALLAEVEDELYQSFKARVFEILKEGYLKARTAVANSN
ncbi:hypothetical protein SAMN05444483_11074 [Salegentibacter echinorum]|uniref:Uncharacterized protein n=1 Tax=Salegentibacter echinorum TaxID=1073325 RepID=A0A1M5JDK5_SALEC|nr:hypothetical protein [Salegentibacter echinorum]SHG38350.1 hypothetical protein SAMN05444483_11074 [Salegentibacter echinorum]